MTGAQKAAETTTREPRARKRLNLAQAYELAVSYHRRGLLGQAEQMYRTLLPAAPKHVGVLHHLGALSTQSPL